MPFKPFFSIFFSSLVAAGTLYKADFASNLGPFSVCNVKAPSEAVVENGNLKTFFDETGFDGTRNDKGVEICVFEEGTAKNVYQMTKEGWQGFSIFVPSDSFPTNKNTIIAQQFCPGGCSSWCGTLDLAGNSLVAEHRAGGCTAPTVTTIVPNIARNTWHDVVVRMKASREGAGAYEVWWDGEKVYSAKNINVGFGVWDSDILTSGWYFKNGQYAYGMRLLLDIPESQSLANIGVLDTENYTNAQRTLLLDNVKWYETDAGETDGYNTVSP